MSARAMTGSYSPRGARRARRDTERSQKVSGARKAAGGTSVQHYQNKRSSLLNKVKVEVSPFSFDIMNIQTFRSSYIENMYSSKCAIQNIIVQNIII